MAFARLLEKKTHLIPGNMLSCFVCFNPGEQHWLKRPLDTGVELTFLCKFIAFFPTGLYSYSTARSCLSVLLLFLLYPIYSHISIHVSTKNSPLTHSF
jgi:hypothetical protein